MGGQREEFSRRKREELSRRKREESGRLTLLRRD